MSETAFNPDTSIRIFGTVTDSIVDGPGLRHSVFVQGCSHHCPGCHNPESQPDEGGEMRTVGELLDEVRANPLIHDVTITGGEPFEQAEACAQLAAELKRLGYGVWVYTGYLYESLLNEADPDRLALLDAADVLVDGPFVEAQKSLTLQWRGSRNQRLIDMPATRASGEIVIWKQPEMKLEKPANW